MQGDIAVPEHHDLVEFQYWAILPLRKELLAAKVFILGQVVYISEGEKPCRSASAENPNVSIIFLAYNYDPASNTYTICGKSGVCKAAKVLLCDVTKFVQMEESGNIKISELPKEYEPFHEDVDIESRLPQEHANQHEDSNTSEEDSDPYLVEKIVQKRFRNNQCEYLVKWCGYSNSDNTWELPSNVPDSILTAFERTLTEPNTPRPRPQGLRQSRKIIHRDDFISS